MVTKQVQLLGLVARLGVGAVLATQLSACSAIGMKTPGEMWDDANDTREPQIIEGARRVPMLNRDVLKHMPAAPQQLQLQGSMEQQSQALPQQPMVNQQVSGEASDAASGEMAASESPDFLGRVGEWFSNMSDDAAFEEPHAANNQGAEQVTMQTAREVQSVALQPTYGELADGAKRRKPISGNPAPAYAMVNPAEKVQEEENMVQEEKAVAAAPVNPAPEKPVDDMIADATPAVVRPDMQTEVIEDEHLFKQSLALSHDAPAQTPESPEVSHAIVAPNLREDEMQAEADAAPESREFTLAAADKEYPPLSSVPPTPLRLREVQQEAPELRTNLENERAVSEYNRAAVEMQQQQEAAESLMHSDLTVPPEAQPANEAPAETQVLQPTSSIEEGASFAALAPASGNESGEFLLAQASDQGVTYHDEPQKIGNEEPAHELMEAPETNQEKAAVNVLDSSFSNGVEEAIVPAPTSPKPELANELPAEEKAIPAVKPRKYAKKRKPKPSSKHMSKPDDYSTVKMLELPASMANSQTSAAPVVATDAALAAKAPPAVEMTATPAEVLAAQQPASVEAPPVVAAAQPERVPAESSIMQPGEIQQLADRTNPAPVAAPAAVPMAVATPENYAPVAAYPAPVEADADNEDARAVASGMVLPPAQFTQAQARIPTDTPAPPPLAPVAANEFLVSSIVRDLTSVFSYTPSYSYLPSWRENRTVGYLPDSAQPNY